MNAGDERRSVLDGALCNWLVSRGGIRGVWMRLARRYFALRPQPGPFPHRWDYPPRVREPQAELCHPGHRLLGYAETHRVH